MKTKFYLLLSLCFVVMTTSETFAQKSSKFSHEIIIDCEQVKTAKMSSESTISGNVKNIDITFPHRTRINPKKGAIIYFKAPGYNPYKLMIPPGEIESDFILYLTENPREASRLKSKNTSLQKEETDPMPTISAEKKISDTQTTDTTIPEGEAKKVVSRDNPGQTALEQTIIRWAFDSDPQGARIFWRVISSVPAQVKNTNETYLTTTPYEETRSFNILGLTYENSRDVQIEVKIVKSGYHTQVKRFNVRQAIDQQEISAFFMLVPQNE